MQYVSPPLGAPVSVRSIHVVFWQDFVLPTRRASPSAARATSGFVAISLPAAIASAPMIASLREMTAGAAASAPMESAIYPSPLADVGRQPDPGPRRDDPRREPPLGESSSARGTLSSAFTRPSRQSRIIHANLAFVVVAALLRWTLICVVLLRSAYRM